MNRFFRRAQPEFSFATIALFALALYWTGCGARPENSKSRSSDGPAVSVQTRIVRSKPQTITEEVVGTVRARFHATLEARLSGRIDASPVVLGQQVKAGELLARIDAAEINARLEQAAASLEHAERELKRLSVLFEKQSSSQAEYEAAQDRQRVAKGALAEAKALMSYVEVRAPFDGVVARKWADVGDLAAPGKPLISLENPSELQLEADVPQTIAAHVRRDDQLTARVDGVRGELAGKVTELSLTADPVSRTFRVKVDLPPQPGLSPGQFARLLVPVGTTDSLRVPASAVVQRGQLEIVFGVENRHALFHLVKTGQRIGDEREILSGLHAGDAVVVAGAAQLTDGQLLEAK
jgi:RND family efflux transporter MFP subunit